MSYLKERLASIDRSVVIEDTVRLIDDEVSRKSGLSGMAIKGGYKVVKKLQGGRMIHKAVDMLLDDFTGALAPVHDEFRAQGDVTSFSDFLVQQNMRASDALLKITDDKAARAKTRVLKKTYDQLRGQAERHVVDALPGVGRLIDRHVPRTQ
ncbi:MAG: hypothetical protein AAGI01_15450 [Myxococcota bacterium]